MNKLNWTVFLLLLFLAATCSAQTDFLSRAPELQIIARRAAGGALGCGTGTLTLVTERGEMQIETGIAPIDVFGSKIVIADLLPLLRARIESNRTGVKNPMSGKVNHLTALTISILGKSQQKENIPLIAALLEDEDDISSAAAISLLKMAQQSEEIRREIELVEFPKKAVISVEGRGRMIPDWVRRGN